MKLPSVRMVNGVAFLICTSLIAFALYLEVHAKLEPCPLCIVQRVIIMVLGVMFALGGIIDFRYKTRRYYHLGIFLVALFGVVIAGRHVWIEFLPPDQLTSCGAGIDYLFQILPASEAMRLIFLGTGECARITWRFLELSIPMWTLIFFGLFTVLALWQSGRKN